jgi:demethylmenaquinone methyltransferase/2-methoxy-6-polyprenyl-1,4-benzoquinol methylase
MIAEKFSQLKHAVLEKAFNICLRCRDSAFNFLFYLPCGGEKSFRRRCIKFASLTAGDWILDVCCGTGELTAMIAGQGSAGQTVGIDISESALEIARTKIRHIPVTFLRAGADNLPFDSSRFDKCFISFGLHHMSGQERQKALTEIHRILTPEGALYVIDYNLPEGGLRRLAAIAFAKLDESEEAYKMLKNGSLIR